MPAEVHSRPPSPVSNTTEFTVRLDNPIDFVAALEMFRRSGDDLLDRWDGTTFVRTIPIDARAIAYACNFEQSGDAVVVHVTCEDSGACDEIERLVRTMFVIPPAGFARLLRADPIIAALHARYPAVRSVRQSNLFNALLRCITTQQVNLRWASTCRRRIAETFGRLHTVGNHSVYSLDPARIAALEPADIRALQLTTSKAEYITNVARTLACGELTLTILDGLTDDQIVTRLSAIRGIGRWSAEWILARSLARPRVVAGDLGVRKAVGLAYANGAIAPAAGRAIVPPEEEVRRLTAHWGDSAVVAQTLLLHALAEKTLAPPSSPPVAPPTASRRAGLGAKRSRPAQR